MTPARQRLMMGLLLLAALGFARLGFWQLSRLHERRAANLVTARARAAAPVTLTAADSAAADTLDEHWVVATGRYDPSHELLLRGAIYQGSPGVRVITPLILDSGAAVLVERGFVPAPDAVSAVMAGLEEPGRVTVRGLARVLPSGGGEPMAHGGRTTWRRLDVGAMRRELPYAVLPIWIQQTPDSALPRFPRRTPLPDIDEGPHLNYAIQWFLFATLAVAFAFLIVGRRPR